MNVLLCTVEGKESQKENERECTNLGHTRYFISGSTVFVYVSQHIDGMMKQQDLSNDSRSVRSVGYKDPEGEETAV